MIQVLLLSLMAIASSQTHKRSACVNLENAFDSFCPSQAERSDLVSLQGRPGKIGPSGPNGEKGRQGIKGDKGSPGEANYDRVEEMISRRIQEVLENQTRKFSEVSNSLTEAKERIQALEKAALLRDCRDAYFDSAISQNKTGGVFQIIIPNVGLKEVYCDLMTDGRNWIVFQRRMDGSVSFRRNWSDYENGFGRPDGEFWLGLGALHQLTRVGNHELRIDMIEHSTGTHYYAKYSVFKIGSATDFYRISLGGFTGNISDQFAAGGQYANGQQFTTFDQDHDKDSGGNCAAGTNGGWWYNKCQHVNLHGLFEVRNGWFGIQWYDRGSHRHMSFTEMKFRRKD